MHTFLIGIPNVAICLFIYFCKTHISLRMMRVLAQMTQNIKFSSFWSHSSLHGIRSWRWSSKVKKNILEKFKFRNGAESLLKWCCSWSWLDMAFCYCIVCFFLPPKDIRTHNALQQYNDTAIHLHIQSKHKWTGEFAQSIVSNFSIHRSLNLSACRPNTPTPSATQQHSASAR